MAIFPKKPFYDNFKIYIREIFYSKIFTGVKSMKEIGEEFIEKTKWLWNL